MAKSELDRLCDTLIRHVKASPGWDLRSVPIALLKEVHLFLVNGDSYRSFPDKDYYRPTIVPTNDGVQLEYFDRGGVDFEIEFTPDVVSWYAEDRDTGESAEGTWDNDKGAKEYTKWVKRALS